MGSDSLLNHAWEPTPQCNSTATSAPALDDRGFGICLVSCGSSNLATDKLPQLRPVLQDLTRIRELACSRGLVNRELRMRCWPLLLGLLPDRQGLLPAPAPSHPPTPLPLSATTASSSRGSSDEGNHCSSSSHGNVQQGLQGGGEGQVHAPGSLDARQSQKSKAVQSQCTCTQQHSLRQQSGAAGNEEDGTVRQGGLVWEEDGELELELEGEEEGGGQGMRADEGCTASTSGVGGVSKQQYEAWHRQGHRDSHVVAVDVVR